MGATQSQLKALPRQKLRNYFSSISGIGIPSTLSIVEGELDPSSVSQVMVTSRGRKNAESHFRFLDLPPEIRNIIYKELMVVDKVFYSPSKYDIVNGSRYGNYKLFRKPELQLLRVCKQIHVEAESVYLSKNIFTLPIEWQKHHPFVDVCRPSEVNVPKPNNKRHLFSSAGLSHIKNISVAVDQKLTKQLGCSFNDWNWDTIVSPTIHFARTTQQERLEDIHNQHVQHICWCWGKMLEHLKLFDGGLLYVEVDFTNAFCGIGDCRPLRELSMQWIQQVRPKAVDVFGIQNMEEKQDLMSSALQCGIRHKELRYKYGLRFRKSGNDTFWGT